jgi:hypothetical protein
MPKKLREARRQWLMPVNQLLGRLKLGELQFEASPRK